MRADRLGQFFGWNKLGQERIAALRGRFCIMRETTYGCRLDLHCYSQVFAHSLKKHSSFRILRFGIIRAFSTYAEFYFFDKSFRSTEV